MKVAMNSLITLAFFAVGAIAQQFMINTPANVVVCQPTQLTWTGGVAPYFLSILPGATPGGEALEQFTGLQGNIFTWNTNIAAGTSIGLTLRDSTGALAQSAAFTINNGPDTSCLSASSGSAASSTPAGSTPVGSTPPASPSPTSPAVSTPPATSPVTSAPPASSPQTSRPASSGSPSSASHSGSSSPSASATGGTSNGAVAQVASLGVAAFVGAAVIAVLA